MDDPERLRKLRERLSTADAELSAFFASTHALVCELSTSGVFMRINPRWQDQLGYSADQLEARLWTEFVHPDDVAVTEQALAKLDTLDSVQFENRLRHTDGSYRSLRWTATRWKAADVVLAVATDMTQRREDERALHELERFEKQVVQSAHEGIMVLDLDLRFLVWNPFMEKLSGLPASRVLGKNALELFAHLRDQEVFGLAKRALFGEVLESGELRYRDSVTERDLWVSVHLNPYRSPQGETIGLIAFVSDITERKLMEEQLQDWKDREPTREPRRENAYGSPPGSEPYSIRSSTGKSNKEIAVVLDISPVTVSSHVTSILRKMHAASRAEAAARAVREDLEN